MIKRLLAGLFMVLLIPSAHAAEDITFVISGMDQANVMRFVDPMTKKVRIGFTQSTHFSHVDKSNKAESVEDGILYFSLMMERLDNGSFLMDISYDFSGSDGTSKGIRSSSTVDENLLKEITPSDLKSRAAQHASMFAPVVYENFLKSKINIGQASDLESFLRSIAEDLLKTLPKDAALIIRRWKDLAGGGAPQV